MSLPTTRLWVAAAIGACCVCAVGAATATSRSESKPKVRTITFVMSEDPSELYTLENPPKGPSGGDVFTYSLTARRKGRVVGRLEGMGAAADAKYQGNVKTEFLVLGNGTIAIVGGGQEGAPGVGRPDSRIFNAIVGGSGAYAGARGWVSGRELSGGRLAYKLHLMR